MQFLALFLKSGYSLYHVEEQVYLVSQQEKEKQSSTSFCSILRFSRYPFLGVVLLTLLYQFLRGQILSQSRHEISLLFAREFLECVGQFCSVCKMPSDYK